MEASEKLNLTEDPTVRVLDGRLVIERLAVEDERAARVVRERVEAGQHPADTVAKAIEIGARVIDSEGTAANVDYVRAELERGVVPLRNELAQTLEEGNEALAEQIATSFGEDRSGSVQHQIKEIVAKANQEQREAISRLFSSDDGANPLTEFRGHMVRGLKELDERRQRDREADRGRIEELVGEVRTLRERLGAKDELEAEQERGTAKGRTFEERVHAAIERIATTRDDIAHHVGDERSDGGGKKGDTLVELGGASAASGERIVFEAKDRKRMSKNEAWAELNEAMARRGAAFAVLVVAGEDKVPSGREQLTEYEGNKLIVAVDREEPDVLALRVAYSLAVARLAMSDRDAGELDAGALVAAAEEARSALKRAQKIRLALTNANECVDKARDGLNEMVDAVEAPLGKIDALASAADA